MKIVAQNHQMILAYGAIEYLGKTDDHHSTVFSMMILDGKCFSKSAPNQYLKPAALIVIYHCGQNWQQYCNPPNVISKLSQKRA